MTTIPLHEFIGTHRDDLIRRCHDRSTTRSTSPPTATFTHGVPLFLDQLVKELRKGPSQTHEIGKGAAEHGHQLLLEGFTVSQVVHDYGDVCQAVTDLAVELDAPIDTSDFRTMNRCLDDAIASAVTEYSRGQNVTRDGESDELRNLITTAINTFDVLLSGRVGITGTTSGGLKRTLAAIRVIADGQSATIPTPMATPTATPVRTRQ